MFHLFNKVYLTLDTHVEINFDRVVISKESGKPMSDSLTSHSAGTLLAYAEDFDKIGFTETIKMIKNFSDESGNAFYIYCDEQNYFKFIVKWYKTIFPNLDKETFKSIFPIVLYNEKLNTMGAYETFQRKIMNSKVDLEDIYDNTKSYDDDRTEIKNLNLNLSFEYLLADYLGGSDNYKQKVKDVVKLFNKRFFTQLTTECAMTIFKNIFNKQYQEKFGFEDKDVDVFSNYPIKKWDILNDEDFFKGLNTGSSFYDTFDFSGLSKEKLEKVKQFIIDIFFGNMMNPDSAYFNDNHKGYLDFISTVNELTDDELDKILDYCKDKPFDGMLVAGEMENQANYVLINYLFKCYGESNAILKKLKLL